jgi:hypothetical protein
VTDPSYAAICLLIDRSGSMQAIRTAAEEGINEFLAGQRTASGKRTVRIDMFDTSFETYCPTKPAAKVGNFYLEPRSATALLDSMARSMREFGAELAKLPERKRPGTVIFAVMTDGYENASTQHTFADVAAMVAEQESTYGWQVLYLGANQDAIKVGQQLGVQPERSMTYAASSAGTRSVTSSLDEYVIVASAGGPAAFTDAQRTAATATD